jgi:hypothetical protein
MSRAVASCPDVSNMKNAYQMEVYLRLCVAIVWEM